MRYGQSMDYVAKIYLYEQPVATVCYKNDVLQIHTRDDSLYQFLNYIYSNACGVVSTHKVDDIRAKYNQMVTPDASDFLVATTQQLALFTPFHGKVELESVNT